jgi:hypothetical protein
MDVVKYQAADGQEVTLTAEMVRRFLVRGKPDMVSNQELVFFMNICRTRKLNPLVKDCHLIKYGNEPAASRSEEIINVFDTLYQTYSRMKEEKDH